MGKFMDNVKTVTGYNAVHRAIMRDVFEQIALGEYSLVDDLPTVAAVRYTACGIATLLGTASFHIGQTYNMLGITAHPYLAAFSLPAFFGGSALYGICHFQGKLRKTLNDAFYHNANEVTKKGVVNSIKDAAILGHNFNFNHRKISEGGRLNISRAIINSHISLAGRREQNDGILKFALASGLVRPKAKTRLNVIQGCISV